MKFRMCGMLASACLIASSAWALSFQTNEQFLAFYKTKVRQAYVACLQSGQTYAQCRPHHGMTEWGDREAITFRENGTILYVLPVAMNLDLVEVNALLEARVANPFTLTGGTRP